ncbi:MAG: hypothetical protein DWH79_01850 [Planctomycetota bacterium]|nr:MAG: hypothetical protein DWH79_01850 [Planctomycetota bacterium]
MLTPPQVVENYFLESRHQILEIAAMMDRYDVAVQQHGSHGTAAGPATEQKISLLRKALAIAADPKPTQDRTVALLELFATG